MLCILITNLFLSVMFKKDFSWRGEDDAEDKF